MTVAKKIESAGYESVLIFENPSYENAFIGVSHDERAVYDYDKMLACLMDEDGMTMEEAAEFIDFNTVRSLPYYSGSPIIVYGLCDK